MSRASTSSKWDLVKLGDIAINGPNNGIFKQRHDFGSGVPIVNVADLYKSSRVNLKTLERVEVSDDELRQYSIKQGDLFFCRSSLKREGIGWCCYAQKVSEPAVFDCHVMRVHLDPERADPEFVAYYWSHPDVRREVIRNSHTATMTTMNQEDLSNVTILLPSIAEQKRIAAIAQKCDRLRRTRRYTQQLSDSYLRSVFLEMFGDPVTNPMNWDVEPLGNSLDRIESGVNFKPISENEPASEWRVLKISAVSFETFNPFASKPISPKTTFNESLIVQKGDLLMSRANTTELVGAVNIVRENPPKVLLPDKLWKLKFSQTSNLKPDYVFYVLRHPRLRKMIGDMASGTSGSMQNITKEETLTLPIPLPPLSLQEKFAQIVQRFERLRAQQREADRQAEHLFQTVLHRAFRGEL